MTTTTETVPVTFHAKVTNKTLHDLFVCAVEGGINYWAGVADYHWGNEDPETGKLVDDIDGFSATIIDLDDEREYRLDADVLRRGLIECARSMPGDANYPGPDASSTALLMLVSDAFPMVDIDVDYDAWIADAIVQVALLGSVVFG